MKSWARPKFVEYEIDGEKLRFYTLGVALLLKMKACGKPLAEALVTLFTARRNVGQEIYEKSAVDGSAEGFFQKETSYRPASVDTLRFISEEERGAVEKLFDAFTSTGTISLLAEIVMDSLREEFSRPIQPQHIQEFIESMDVATLADCLIGVYLANAEKFGPLVKKLARKMESTAQSLSTPGTSSKNPSSGSAEESEPVPSKSPTSTLRAL